MFFEEYKDHVTSFSPAAEKKGIKPETLELLFLNAEIVEQEFYNRRHVDMGKSGEIWRASSDAIPQGVCLKTLHTKDNSANSLTREFELHNLFYEAGVRVPLPMALSRWWEGDGEVNEHLAMEFLHGQNLADFIIDILSHKQEISGKEWIRIVADIKEQIEKAHTANLYHRDLDPKNVFLRGPDREVFIIDFGDAISGVGKAEDEIYQISTHNYPRDENIIRNVNSIIVRAKVLS